MIPIHDRINSFFFCYYLFLVWFYYLLMSSRYISFFSQFVRNYIIYNIHNWTHRLMCTKKNRKEKLRYRTIKTWVFQKKKKLGVWRTTGLANIMYKSHGWPCASTVSKHPCIFPYKVICCCVLRLEANCFSTRGHIIVAMVSTTSLPTCPEF